MYIYRSFVHSFDDAYRVRCLFVVVRYIFVHSLPIRYRYTIVRYIPFYTIRYLM